MLKKLWNHLKTKSWIKILAFILLFFSGAGIIVGIIFSALNFSKIDPTKEGSQFGGGVQTQITVKLRNGLTTQQQLQQVEKDANALVRQLKIGGVKEISAQASLNDAQIVSNSIVPAYGSIYLYTEQNNNLFSYSSSLDTQSEATQNFQIYTKLTNNYNLQLENANSFAANSSNNLNKNVNFSNNVLDLNSNRNAKLTTFNNIPGLKIKLPTSVSANENDWNLNAFQQQFTTVFPGWNNKLTYQELINKNKDNMTKKGNEPNKILVLWKNRSGLIQELQLIVLVSYLHENLGSLGSSSGLNTSINQVTLQTNQINGVYNSFNSDQKNFGSWALVNITSVMNQLYAAQNYGFGLSASQTQDPLLNLLAQYYSSAQYESLKTNGSSTSNPWINNPNQFLYSWNFSNLSLVNSYFQPIDYYNFWQYFEKASNNKSSHSSTSTEASKTNYSSNTFVMPLSSTDSKLQLNDQVNLYNNGSYNSIIFNPYLNQFKDYSQAATQTNANNFSNFLGFIQKTPNPTKNSVTTLNTFNGTVVGISIIVLIIGIIVSLLYRFPGVLAFLMSTLIFLLTSSIYLSLDLTFSFDTFMALMSMSIMSYIPFMSWMEYIKRGINKGLNLQNATLHGLKAYLRNAVTTFIAILIVALIFLFFGSNQVQGFGAILVVGSLLTILFYIFAFIPLYYVMHWVLLNQKPQFLLFKKYVQSLIEIHKVRFNSFVDINQELENKSLLDKMINPLIRNLNKGGWALWIPMVIFMIIGIIGCILLGTLGPSASVEFGTTTIVAFKIQLQSSSTSSSALINPLLANNNALINQLAKALHISWYRIEASSIYKDYLGNSWQTVALYTAHNLSPQTIFNVVNSVQSSLLANLSVRVQNTYWPNVIKLNLFEIVMISIGFLSIWSFIVLNFINIIPIAFVLSVLAIFSAGIVGFFRIPADTNTLVSYGQIWLIIVFFTYYQFVNYKFNFEMKIRHTPKDLLRLTFIEFKKQIGLLTLNFVIYFFSTLIMILFSSASFVFAILTITLSLFLIYFVSIALTPLMFSAFMIIRDLYLSRIITSRKTKTTHHIYDKIDEQEIYGINKH